MHKIHVHMHTHNILEIVFWHFNDNGQYLVTRIIFVIELFHTEIWTNNKLH